MGRSAASAGNERVTLSATHVFSQAIIKPLQVRTARPWPEVAGLHGSYFSKKVLKEISMARKRDDDLSSSRA
jgi:hypothetical protein